MGGYVLFSHALGEPVGDALDEAAGVDEDEGGTVLVGELFETRVNLIPHFVGSDGAKFGGGEFDGQVEGAGGGDDYGDCVTFWKIDGCRYGACVVVPTFATSGRMWATSEIQNRLLFGKLGAAQECRALRGSLYL
jgi:hypothetical protein